MAIYHDTPYLKVLAKLRYPSLNANPQVNTPKALVSKTDMPLRSNVEMADDEEIGDD